MPCYNTDIYMYKHMVAKVGLADEWGTVMDITGVTRHIHFEQILSFLRVERRQRVIVSMM